MTNVPARVLVLGGYGNFGSFISKRLARETNLHLIIAGRSFDKAQEMAEQINAEAEMVDINGALVPKLKEIAPDIVIHTCGPFQDQGYQVAEACIECGAHYIDLADGRDFVVGIHRLNERARQAGVLVVSGASSVPCLTYALIDHYRATGLAVLDAVDYGITTAQKTARGLATTAAILSYTGKPFLTLLHGGLHEVYGWQGFHVRKIQGLGWRLFGNCNVPDLALFPDLFPELKTVRFSAGLELPFIHIALWALSWMVRMGLVSNLVSMAPQLLKLSSLFDWMGSANSGFYMRLAGKNHNGVKKVIHFELIARQGDGPYIPCMPAILVTQKLASGQILEVGAKPCVGIINRKEYLDALDCFDISWVET